MYLGATEKRSFRAFAKKYFHVKTIPSSGEAFLKKCHDNLGYFPTADAVDYAVNRQGDESLAHMYAQDLDVIHAYRVQYPDLFKVKPSISFWDFCEKSELAQNILKLDNGKKVIDIAETIAMQCSTFQDVDFYLQSMAHSYRDEAFVCFQKCDQAAYEFCLPTPHKDQKIDSDKRVFGLACKLAFAYRLPYANRTKTYCLETPIAKWGQDAHVYRCNPRLSRER